MKYLKVVIILLIVSSCKTVKNKTFSYDEKQRISKDSIYVIKPKKVPTAYKGFKYPYIHINGYSGYEISKSRFLKYQNLNELKYYHTYSSFYTRKSMYEKFGDWDITISIKGQRTPYLIWKNIKLFKDDDRKFTVIAGGYECPTCKSDNDRIYSSIFLLDQNGNDLLLDQNSELVKKTMQFFFEGIKNLTNSNEFYNKFWKLAKKY